MCIYEFCINISGTNTFINIYIQSLYFEIYKLFD